MADARHTLGARGCASGIEHRRVRTAMRASPSYGEGREAKASATAAGARHRAVRPAPKAEVLHRAGIKASGIIGDVRGLDHMLRSSAGFVSCLCSARHVVRMSYRRDLGEIDHGSAVLLACARLANCA